MTVTVCLISYLRGLSELRGSNKNKHEIKSINYAVYSAYPCQVAGRLPSDAVVIFYTPLISERKGYEK